MTLYSWVCLGCDTNISIRDCLYCIWNVADVSRLFYCRKLSLPGDEWQSNQLWYVQIILSFHDIFTFWILLRFPRKYDIGFDLPSSCLWEGSCHIYVICFCMRIVCNVFGFFCPRLGYPMLKVSLDCPFFIASLFFSIF
jgi:hypothetical protein